MARTVANGRITQALLDTQADASRTPYIRINIDSTDYSSKLLFLEHHEEAYRDRAIIGLSNRDGSLDELDLLGKSFEIGYGYDSSGHGGSTTDYVSTPPLWVKSHQIISIAGERVYQIYAEGMWMRLREQRLIAGINKWAASTAYAEGQYTPPTTPNGHIYKCTVAGTTGATEPTWPTTLGSTVTDGTVTWTEAGLAATYSNIFPGTHTVEELIKLIIESFGWTWNAVTNSDGLIDTFKPVFEINNSPFETAAALLYRLIWMTKSYLRAKESTTFEAAYPQTGDEPDVIYYNAQAPWFHDHAEKVNLLIPNSIIVICNQDPNGQWNTASYPIIIGTKKDDNQIAKYYETTQLFVAGNIRTQEDADNRADAILTRLKAETLAGRLLVPHDARVELYDKPRIFDTRVA